MFDYFIKAFLFQILFLILYDILLKKETFFRWNRWYLLATPLLSYCIPLVSIKSVVQFVPQKYIIALPEVVLTPSKVIEQAATAPEQVFNYMQVFYWTGFVVALIIFLIKLSTLYRLLKMSNKITMPEYILVTIENTVAFSFFNYIFLGNGISKADKQKIISHELIHVKQWHSFDLLFFEFQKMLCWFNPLSYIYQNRIAEIHEYIADAQSVKNTDITTYFNRLLAETFGVMHLSFINPFLKHSLIKKRIVMLQKNRSKKLLRLKYLFLVPVLAGMLLYSSCEKEEENEINIGKNEKHSLSQQIDGEAKTESPKSKDYANENVVPFAVIDKAPVFPGCEDAKDKKKCFEESIRNHVQKNFNIALANTLGLKPDKKRVYVQFKIKNDGNITHVKARGTHQQLEKEAQNVIYNLPQMIPGEHNGKKVAVKYTLPITLIISEKQ